ncbi:hypothetical protein AAVH_12067 [Aphelenchoides avenae]|nr:hypothetical protein AAVH_12067 [Aphelenchus avenae]
MTREEDEPVYRVSDDLQSFHLDENPIRVHLKNDSIDVNTNGRVTLQIRRRWCGFHPRSESEGVATYRLQAKPFFRGLHPCTCHLIFPSWTRVEQLPSDYTLKEETEAEKIWYEIMSRTRLFMSAFDVIRLKVEVRKESFEFIREADNIRVGYSREVSRAWEASLSILGHYLDAGFHGVSCV